MSIKLQPSWLGNINWSNGLPLSPENYKLEQMKIFDYWGEYRSPVWDDMYEYRKLLNKNNYNSFDKSNNYKENTNESNNDNQFITIYKNKKKTLPSSQYIKLSKNYDNTNNNAENDLNIESDESTSDIEEVEYIINKNHNNYKFEDENI